MGVFARRGRARGGRRRGERHVRLRALQLLCHGPAPGAADQLAGRALRRNSLNIAIAILLEPLKLLLFINVVHDSNSGIGTSNQFFCKLRYSILSPYFHLLLIKLINVFTVGSVEALQIATGFFCEPPRNFLPERVLPEPRL